jgi:hypothetical protein
MWRGEKTPTGELATKFSEADGNEVSSPVRDAFIRHQERLRNQVGRSLKIMAKEGVIVKQSASTESSDAISQQYQTKTIFLLLTSPPLLPDPGGVQTSQ